MSENIKIKFDNKDKNKEKKINFFRFLNPFVKVLFLAVCF